VEVLENNNALMHQDYASVVFDPNHKYVEMGLYLNNSTGNYDIVEIRVFYGNFLDTFNTEESWYAKSVSFTGDFSQEYYSGRKTNFTFANGKDGENGEQGSSGGDQQGEPQDPDNGEQGSSGGDQQGEPQEPDNGEQGSSDGDQQGEPQDPDNGEQGSSGGDQQGETQNPGNGEQGSSGGNQQGETQEIENTVYIGTATEGVYAGTRFYIGTTGTSLDTPSYVYSMPGWHLHLGSDWDNTSVWKSDVEYMLSTYKIKKGNKTVSYSELPDYNGTGARNNRMQHYVFSLGLTEEQSYDHSTDPGTQENFFGVTPDGYLSGNYSGGILYHWTWDSVDKIDELGDILVQKGYHLTYTSSQDSGAMDWHGTRVEMNTISSPRYYSVEYFDGEGNYWWRDYSK
jgi:hypothetical protein